MLKALLRQGFFCILSEKEKWERLKWHINRNCGRRLHDGLYQGMLAAFKKDMKVVFQTEIKHVTVEKIGEKGESITEAEIPLL